MINNEADEAIENFLNHSKIDFKTIVQFVHFDYVYLVCYQCHKINVNRIVMNHI